MANLNISDYFSYTNNNSAPSDGISSLFSSLNSNNSNKLNTTNIMGVDLSNYSSIKNGSYYKAMKKQYASDNTQSASKADIEAYKKKQEITSDKSAALSSTINDLMDMKYTEDNKGAIADKVKKFAEEYNSLMKNASSSTSPSIKQKADWMKNMIAEYSSQLSQVGVDVSSSGEVTINDEQLKNAKLESLKDAFGAGINSISNKVLYKAEQIYSLAKTYGASATAYTSNGTYNRDYSGNYDTTT